MTSLPNSNNNNNKNVNTNKMWKDDIDSPQASVGGGFRGVPIGSSSQADCMAFEESFHNGNMQVWDVKGSQPLNSKNSKNGKNSSKQKIDKKLKENNNVETIKQQEDKVKMNENEKNDENTSLICVRYNYRDPVDNFRNDRYVKPLIYNRDFCVLDCPHSSLNADKLKKAVVLQLNKLVLEGYIDWDYESKYTFSGRIYKENEDAGYRITIYLLKEYNDEEEECVLEVRRNGGDSFLFHEFKSKFLGLVSDNKSIINYEKTANFTMEGGFLSLMSDDDNSDDSDDDVLSESKEDLLRPLSLSSSSSNVNNDFDAKICVAEAIDSKKYGVLRYRHCVAFLRNCSDNDSKLNKIMKVDNVIDKLLSPINGNDKIYDTLVIKSLLEVIYKILCKDSSVASKDNTKTIKNINQEWSRNISHPYSDIIGKFLPSQQIQWISNKCIRKFSNCST